MKSVFTVCMCFHVRVLFSIDVSPKTPELIAIGLRETSTQMRHLMRRMPMGVHNWRAVISRSQASYHSPEHGCLVYAVGPENDGKKCKSSELASFEANITSIADCQDKCSSNAECKYYSVATDASKICHLYKQCKEWDAATATVTYGIDSCKAPDCLSVHEGGCNTITDEPTCLSSRNPDEAAEGPGQACVWCNSSCDLGNDIKCAPHAWMVRKELMRDTFEVASCPNVQGVANDDVKKAANSSRQNASGQVANASEGDEEEEEEEPNGKKNKFPMTVLISVGAIIALLVALYFGQSKMMSEDDEGNQQKEEEEEPPVFGGN